MVPQMKLHLSLLLSPCLKNSPVRLSVSLLDGSSNTVELNDDSAQTVKYHGELNYSYLPKFIKIFRVDGFVPGLGQKIIIKEMKINDRTVETASFFNLLDFSVRDNKFVSDRQIDNCHEICFNGELLLAVEKNRDRLFWCPYYYSPKKDDFVFMNYRPDDYISDVGRGDQGISKLRNYRNIPHHDYDIDKIYDVACFGCSVTYGTFLETKNIWTNLLSKNSLNLAVPGLGVDGIFLNLKNSLKKFKFEKIIILLPNFERRLLRVRLFGSAEFCRIPITAGAIDWAHSRFKDWAWDQVGVHVGQEQVGQWKKQYNNKFINLFRDEECIYSKRVFSLLLKLCNSTNKKFYFSSWDQEAYDHIIDTVEMSNILPFFKTSDRAKDYIHPGVKSHAAWANEVSNLVNVGGQN